MGHAVKTIVSFGIVAMLTVGVSTTLGANESGGDATAGAWPLVPTHAIRGVVKSMSSTGLVIIPSRNNTSEMLFILSALNHREGLLAVGATVSIRYRVENQTFLATAVSTHPEKQHVRHAEP